LRYLAPKIAEPTASTRLPKQSNPAIEG